MSRLTRVLILLALQAEIYKSMEITFPEGIGWVRGRFKSYKSLQGIAASRDGVGSAGAGLRSPALASEIYKSMEITFPAGIGRVRGQIKSYKSLQGIAGCARWGGFG